jgi:prepilin-type N-terminal cleavage/methylation domain-containing protein
MIRHHDRASGPGGHGARRRPVPRERAGGRLDGRSGFTLVEVLVAMLLLTTVVVGLAMSTVVFSRSVADASGRTRAQAIADMQINRALVWPSYGTLTTLSTAAYNGSFDGYQLATSVSVDSTSRRNRTVVTVNVTSSVPGRLPTPVTRSITIAAP